MYQKECDAERPAWTDSGGEFLVKEFNRSGRKPIAVLRWLSHVTMMQVVIYGISTCKVYLPLVDVK
jgi:hypothetical protein